LTLVSGYVNKYVQQLILNVERERLTDNENVILGGLLTFAIGTVTWITPVKMQALLGSIEHIQVVIEKPLIPPDPQ
jgi:hypothetical protein